MATTWAINVERGDEIEGAEHVMDDGCCVRFYSTVEKAAHDAWTELKVGLANPGDYDAP